MLILWNSQAQIQPFLLTLSPDLVEMRSRFYSPDAFNISLTRDEFDRLWPYMDNMYTFSTQNPLTKDRTCSVYYNRRLFPHEGEYTPGDIAERQRNRSCRTAVGCPAKGGCQPSILWIA